MTSQSIVSDLCDHGLHLTRAWPRTPDHLLLEVEGGHGPVAGQWFAEESTAERVSSSTPGAERVGHVVLQPGGADRRLEGLRGLVAEPGNELVAHRAERRAVVRGSTGYTKLVRGNRLEELVRTAKLTEALPLRTPRVIDVDPTIAAVTLDTVPGKTLHEILDSPDAIEACHATGSTLAELHSVPVPAGTRSHGPAEETAVLQRWIDLATAYGLEVGDDLRSIGLPDGTNKGRACLLQRDLHDKQVLVADDGSVGIVDFDLLAAGDPALDLANLLVHLRLRVAQGLLSDANPMQDALLDGYRPDETVLARVPAYARATRARLRAIYAFRPDSVSVDTL